MLRSYPRGIIAENPPSVKHVGGVEEAGDRFVLLSLPQNLIRPGFAKATPENSRTYQFLIAQRGGPRTLALGQHTREGGRVGGFSSSLWLWQPSGLTAAYVTLPSDSEGWSGAPVTVILGETCPLYLQSLQYFVPLHIS